MASPSRFPPDQQPPGEPPPPERRRGVIHYRDAVVARPVGFRPLLLDLAVPERAEPVPLVVHIYGGGFAMGSHKHDQLGQYLAGRLLPEGFAVAHVQYRHSKEEPFPTQLHDIKAAVRWLRRHSAALALAPTRFAAWGSSSGGHLATMLAVTGDRPDLDGAVGLTGVTSTIQAAISWNAPVDIARLPPPPAGSPFHALGEDPHDWLLGAPVAARPDLAAAASTITYASAAAAPLLLVHGEQDVAIPIDQSRQLVAACTAAGATAELLALPHAGHVLADDDRAQMVTRGIDFLRRHVVRQAVGSRRDAGDREHAD
jgi:acetyl esterase/lipase